MYTWKIYTWRRQWHPTPVLLPGKSHGWRSLVGCSPWGCLEKEMATHSSVLAWRIPGTGSLVGAVYGVSRSWTQLKRLSSSSSSLFQVSFSFKAHVYSNLIEGYVPRTFLELSVSSAGNTFLFFTI